MLFDLRGRGRRNTIKVVYILLAFLMGGGLILFGIGGNTSGGLVDAITGSSGSGDVGAERYEKEITDMRARLQADPKDEEAWAELIRAQVSLAATGDQYNATDNTYTEAGKADLRAAVDSWEKFQAIDPKNGEEEARVASRIVQAYASLEDLNGLVAAQEVVALNREAVGPYAALAQYAYLAGQTRKGDLAAQKALELEDPDQRSTLKSDLDSYKAQAAPPAVESATPAATSSPTPEAKKSGKKSGKTGDKPKQSDK
jgi:hypothetical protein